MPYLLSTPAAETYMLSKPLYPSHGTICQGYFAMPAFKSHLLLPRPIGEVFDFFTVPANWVRIAPPDAHLKLLDGPERLKLGSSFTCATKHLGLTQRLVIEVAELQPAKALTLRQRQGPLKKWVHATLFAETAEGTELQDRVEFEPPGGILGLFVTARFIESNLRSSFAHREKKLRDLLS
jgi:ligand-binding SRPBCC domain-containing protein